MNKKTVKDMTVTALLVALSVVIPMTFPQVPLPQPFSATLASHVPVMVAMFISPWSVLAVVIGSAIGFFSRLGIVVAARAATHLFFAMLGLILINKKTNLIITAICTMLLHAIAEGLTVLAFGNSLYFAAYTVGVGTMIHHAVDFIITVPTVKALAAAKVINAPPKLL